MKNRRGEKAGWIGGWLGGFLWVNILSVVFLFQGKTVEGVGGLVLLLIAVFFVFVFAPWRHPVKRFWSLMLPLYLIFFGSVAWITSSFGGFEKAGLGWWQLGLIFPMVLPVIVVGRRKWSDGEPNSVRK